MNSTDRLTSLWSKIYPQDREILETVFSMLEQARKKIEPQKEETDPQWFKKAVVYCLYVDRFAGCFQGLTDRISYLQDLGINCLWLLPILDSPMRDEGFDIRDYYQVRDDLLDSEEKGTFSTEFQNFLQKDLNQEGEE